MRDTGFAATVAMVLLTEVPFPSVVLAASENHVDAREVKWKTDIDHRYGPGLRFRILVGDRHLPTMGDDVFFGEAEWAPGAIYVGHKHPAPEIYYIISGEADWTIDGVTFRARPGTAIYTEPNAVHRVVNVGNGVLKTIWFWWAPNGDTSVLNKSSVRVQPIEKQPASAKFPD